MTDDRALGARRLGAGRRASAPATCRARELLEPTLERIERFDPTLNAVCYLDADAARAAADEIDAAVAAGDDPGPFAGVPMGVKELAQVEGWPDTHASRRLRGQRRRRATTPRSRACARPAR